MDDATRAQLHDQAVKEMIFEKLSNKQLDKLGFVFTKEEENDIIKGSHPHQLIGSFPYFKDDKRQVQLSEAIKAIGEYPVTVKVFRDVTAQIKVHVEKENQE